MIDNNTTSRLPTHFLAAVPLIVEARGTCSIPSENWAYPTEYRLGTPNEDDYYAEVWYDGMDWQTSFWVVEAVNLANPKATPLLVFEDHKNKRLFNNYDFRRLMMALLHCRRDKLWLHTRDYSRHQDEVWCRLTRLEEGNLSRDMVRYQFEHASQPAVQFFVNELFLPILVAGVRMGFDRTAARTGLPAELPVDH